MGFRINRGIFQFKDAATETFINKFKIDDRDGTLVEVDSDGNAVTGYLKVGEKATDANLLDGLDSGAFLRSNASDDMYGTLTVHSGGANSYGQIRGYGNDNHFIVMRGIVSTNTSTLTITGGHRTTFVEHAEGNDNTGWYFVSKQTGKYQEVARITRSGITAPNYNDSNWNTAYNWGNHASAGYLNTSVLSEAQAGLLKTSLGVSGLPYTCDIVLNGDPNLFYPVHFFGGDQNIWRRIIISRNYSWQAPPDWYTATHKGGLLLDWEGNFGGWGGALYSDRLRTFNEMYSNMVADMYRFTHSMGYVFFLRGGGDTGALYRIFSDQPINGRHQSGTPDIGYDPSFVFYPNNNASYVVTAPEPLTLAQINTRRIDELRTLKRSELNAIYQPVGSYLTTSGKAADSNLLDGIDSSGFWQASGSWKPTSLNSMTRVIGITAESGSSNFAIATGGGKMYPYTDGIFYQNEGAYAVLDTNSGYTRTAANAAFDAAGSADAVRTDLTSLIATATDTADNAATAASNAQTTANTALARADGAREDTVAIGELATAAQAAADAAQATADGKLGATAKAADSNLLDGIDSSAFLRSNAADTFTGTLTMGTQKALVANNYGRGVYGIYSATRYQHVWSMGTAYNLADNGTGAGNLYGIAWTHQNIGGESISGLGHQMLIMSNGDTRSAIGDGIWTKYNIYASGGNSTEWNAAYDWGNHAGLYDTVGSAAGVNTRIDDEIVPQITANTDAIINNRNEITTVGAAAAAAQSTADGKANASHDHDRLYISDTRGAARAPSYYNDRYAQWDFQNESDTGITAGDSWQALLTVSKWSVFDPSHKQEQLIFTGDDLYRRTATSDTAWGTTKKIWDTGNLNPIVSATVSNDTTTFTKADGSTFALTTSDANSNTYVTGASFNTGNGVLTLTRNSGSVTVDLDGRYDGVGSAAGVNTRIDDEIVPQITANATAIARNATALDTKLASTGKAADSNLLDGVDSSRFVYGGNATKTTNISNVSTALASGFYDGYNITGSPTGTWYTYINMRHNNTGNNYGSQIAVSFYSNADMYVRTISNGTYQGWSKIWNSANFDPSSKANTSHDHNDLYYTKAQSNANYDAAGSASTAQTNAINAANVRIDDEVFPAINTNTTNIARNATEIATKAAAGGSYSQDFAADDMRVDQWFRNTVSGKGLYNEATTQHFYSDDDNYWNVAGGTDVNGIRFRDEHGGTIRGYVYATSNNEVGFLDSDGSWAVRVVRDNYVEFRDNNEVTFRVGQGGVDGDYGTVCTHGTGKNGWEGYSINGWWVFMSSDGSNSGIYNDVDNEWMTRWYRNGATELMHNGSVKLATTSGGVSVTGSVSATSFSGDGSALTNLNVPDQSIPVSINGEGGNILLSMNMNLDRGQIEFTLSNGQTFTAQMGR